MSKTTAQRETAAAGKPAKAAPRAEAPAKKAPAAKKATAKPAEASQPETPTQVGARSADAKSSKAAKAAAPQAPTQPAPTTARPSASGAKASRPESPMPQTATKVDPKLANAWKSKAGRDLTDEEVLAMPDSEYMNDKQMEFFRTRLEQLKNDLLSNAGETTEHLREDTSIVPDPADRATIEEEHALELRTRDRERKLLKKISQALARIEAGDYGYCDETGEPIGLGRLIARPTATLSLEAQQRRELKQKLFGD
ncbi:MAG: RNA polymerase-binding protein DksA [Burkholderiales bacterium]|nr:RNA polymerase-binding protein DksA [Burkholderiales bacterium]